MPLLALALALIVQEPAAAPAQDLYQAPAIRPFEPDWDFSAGVTLPTPDERDPGIAAVSVDRYTADYERAPTATERAYVRGVESAEARRDALMGPLDGLWRVRDADGRILLEVLLTDPGADGPIVGAWRDLDGVGAVPELGVFALVARRGGGLQALFRKDGATADNELELAPDRNGRLIGTLRYEGRTRNVSLERQP